LKKNNKTKEKKRGKGKIIFLIILLILLVLGGIFAYKVHKNGGGIKRNACYNVGT